jgi:phosphatidylserine/phosphatidylglycerophosphate/cardiolipin synthase-like enzyme
MKRVIIVVALLMLVSASVSGASPAVQMTVGSNVIKVDGKPMTLSQNVAKTDAGIMIPIDVLPAGLGATVRQKDNVIDVTPKDSPEIEYIIDNDKGLGKLLKQFDQAKSFVYVQMYQINNQTIIDKIKKTRDRGIKIMVILDENSENRKSNVVNIIRDNKNCYVHLIKKPGFLIYHKKIAIFDGKSAFIGSSNWTNAGFGGNNEQNFLIKSSVTAGQMKESFLDEWNPNRK